MKKLIVTLLLTTLATGAVAHSRVDTTTPKDGTTVAEVPAEISFNFANDIRLTRIDMTHQDHPSVELDLGDQKSFRRVYILPLETMGEGTYRIEWRGLGVDGHAMQGEFTFEVD